MYIKNTIHIFCIDEQIMNGKPQSAQDSCELLLDVLASKPSQLGNLLMSTSLAFSPFLILLEVSAHEDGCPWVSAAGACPKTF